MVINCHFKLKKMKSLILKFTLLLCIVCSLIFLPNCKKDNSNNPGKINAGDSTYVMDSLVYLQMQSWYLWYDKLPAKNTLNIKSYTDPQKFLNAIVYKPTDKWSFIITKEEYNMEFTQGVFYGHGFSLGLDETGKFRIAFVFKNSDLFKAGVKRGWIIEKINNVVPDTSNVYNLLGPSAAGIQNIFLFQRPDGTETTDTFVKKEVTENMVLYRDTFHVDNKIVGYLVFKGFLANGQNELDTTFDYFNKTGVNELVLDLRYNGGGDLDMANHLASIIAGSIANNQTFATLTYNDIQTKNNISIKLTNNSRSLHLTWFLAITTRGTASASEAVINGLIPYMPDSKIIGDTTYGKPVGMNVWLLSGFDYVFAPVTFKLTNSNNNIKYGDYLKGIPADKEEPDDLTHDFGDRNEACFAQALYYIQNGNFSTSKKATNFKNFNHHWKPSQLETEAY